MADEKGNNRDGGKEVPNTEVFRVRTSEAISTLALPIVITVIGLIISFMFNLFSDRDKMADQLRKECRYEIREAVEGIRRELAASERTNGETHKAHERRLVWIEQALNDWSWKKSRSE